MRQPGVRQFLRYATPFSEWRSYLRSPGDGRVFPQIPAVPLLRSLVATRLLRQKSFLAVEALVCSPAHQAMGVRTTFGDDMLAYFTDRLDVERLRLTTVGVDLNPRKM